MTTTVYIITKDHLCDDPHYQASPSFYGAYRTREAAQAVVDKHTKECEQEYREYFELAEGEPIPDMGYMRLWAQFPELYIREEKLEG